MIGRAEYVKSDTDTALPSDLEVVHEWWDMPLAQKRIIVSGERLPRWEPGSYPWQFENQAAMLEYRQGSH